LGPALFSCLPRLVGKKTVVTVQGLDWQRKKWGFVAQWALRLGEKASAHLPNRTMVVSQVLQERYRTLHGVEAIFVPNGTEIRKRRQASRILQWGLEPDRYVLFLGRFSPEKNCHLLVEAFERLNTRVKLVLAGGSSHTSAYVDRLRQHQGERILLLDWVSNEAFEELLTNAALFVLPSDLEGLSLALLDAMGAGVCVVTSDIPENVAVVDGVGFTFRAADAVDLSRILEVLLSNPKVRALAAQKAQQKVQEQYLWPGIVDQVAQVYEQLAGGKGAAMPVHATAPVERSSERVA